MCEVNKYFGVVLIETDNYGIVLVVIYKRNTKM